MRRLCSVKHRAANVASHSGGRALTRCTGAVRSGFLCAGGAAQPQECHLGTWCSAGHQYNCSANSYGRRITNTTTEPRSDQGAACTPCKSNAMTLPGVTGATNISECACVSGYYRMNNSIDECKRWPPGATEELATNSSLEPPDTVVNFRLWPGYWRISNATDDVRPCPKNRTSGPSCAGDVKGELGDYCNQNASGISNVVPYCSHCVRYPEEYLDLESIPAKCKPCSGPRFGLLAYTLVLFSLPTGVLLLQRFGPQRWALLVSYAKFVKMVARRVSPIAKFKICQSFCAPQRELESAQPRRLAGPLPARQMLHLL